MRRQLWWHPTSTLFFFLRFPFALRQALVFRSGTECPSNPVALRDHLLRLLAEVRPSFYPPLPEIRDGSAPGSSPHCAPLA